MVTMGHQTPEVCCNGYSVKPEALCTHISIPLSSRKRSTPFLHHHFISKLNSKTKNAFFKSFLKNYGDSPRSRLEIDPTA